MSHVIDVAPPVDPARTHVTGRRVVQLVVDYLLFGVLLSGSNLVIDRLNPSRAQTLDFSFHGTQVFGSWPRLGAGLLMLVAWLLVFAVLPAWWDRTPGMALTGLRVERLYGGRAAFWQHLVRAVLLPLDLIGLVVPGLVVMLFSRWRQRIGDHVAGTVVTHNRNGLPRDPEPRGRAAG